MEKNRALVNSTLKVDLYAGASVPPPCCWHPLSSPPFFVIPLYSLGFAVDTSPCFNHLFVGWLANDKGVFHGGGLWHDLIIPPHTQASSGMMATRSRSSGRPEKGAPIFSTVLGNCICVFPPTSRGTVLDNWFALGVFIVRICCTIPTPPQPNWFGDKSSTPPPMLCLQRNPFIFAHLPNLFICFFLIYGIFHVPGYYVHNDGGPCFEKKWWSGSFLSFSTILFAEPLGQAAFPRLNPLWSP